MGSQPQNHEFRSNPDNFHPCVLADIYLDYCYALPPLAENFSSVTVFSVTSTLLFHLEVCPTH